MRDESWLIVYTETDGVDAAISVALSVGVQPFESRLIQSLGLGEEASAIRCLRTVTRQILVHTAKQPEDFRVTGALVPDLGQDGERLLGRAGPGQREGFLLQEENGRGLGRSCEKIFGDFEGEEILAFPIGVLDQFAGGLAIDRQGGLFTGSDAGVGEEHAQSGSRVDRVHFL